MLINKIIQYLFLFLSGCGIKMVVTEDRYWDYGFSSPDFYKMSVEYVQASMRNGDNVKLHAAGVIGGNRTKYGYELKPIQGSPFHQEKYIDAPDIIVVSWFSYAEQKFYAVKITFNEVAKKILSTPYYGHCYKDNSIKNHIVIGLAPGGYLTVWLNGTCYDDSVKIG